MCPRHGVVGEDTVLGPMSGGRGGGAGVPGYPALRYLGPARAEQKNW